MIKMCMCLLLLLMQWYYKYRRSVTESHHPSKTRSLKTQHFSIIGGLRCTFYSIKKVSVCIVSPSVCLLVFPPVIGITEEIMDKFLWNIWKRVGSGTRLNQSYFGSDLRLNELRNFFLLLLPVSSIKHVTELKCLVLQVSKQELLTSRH